MAAKVELTYSTELKKFRAETLTTIKAVYDDYKKLFDQLSDEIEKHSKSGHAIPDVSAKIGKTGISAVKAMRAVNEAAFEGQKLTNSYNVLYAPRMNELLWDSKILVETLTNRFMVEPEVQDIKTSAEKERQRDMFCFEVDSVRKELLRLNDSLYYLGRYVENIVYSLDRMQRMIDSLDRLAARELWVDSKAQDEALNVIADNKEIDDSDELDASDFKRKSSNYEEDDDEL